MMKDKKISLEESLARLAADHHLIIASNRGPLKYEMAGGRLKARRGGGGLISALDAVLKTSKAIWVAAALSTADREKAAEGKLINVPEDEPLYQVKLINLPAPVFDAYYNVISNRYIWYVQHYLFDLARRPLIDDKVKSAWRDGYRTANREFAAAVAAQAGGDESPVVLLHDYHLYLAASFLRRLKPKAVIFQFLHTPWCCPDYFRVLPAEFRRQILASLAANDIIGFHTRRYADNFLNCCRIFLGATVDLSTGRLYWRNREARVNVYPISVDVSSLRAAGAGRDVRAAEPPLRSAAQKYRLIVRVDRAELSKNLLRGFDAYALMLRRSPEWRKKVKFLAFAYPTRSKLTDYRDYGEAARRRVELLNEKFGTEDWQPAELEIADNYPRSLAALKNYDVLMTNPIFDGMNLVAKEGAILNERNGVILLSENAGAYVELRESVLGFNPFDIDETAAKLEEALNMTPLEKSRRARRLREIVEHNDINRWLSRQVKDIQGLIENN